VKNSVCKAVARRVYVDGWVYRWIFLIGCIIVPKE